MMALALTANNSSGEQLLIFTRQKDGEITPRLIGRYEGKDLDVCFDEINGDDLDDFIAYLQAVRARKAGGE